MDDAIRSDKVDPEEIKYVWRGIPLGMPTLVAGRPGEGKSLFAAFLTAEVTRKGGTVIFSNMEDPLPQVVRPRLEAAGADLEKVFFWTPTLPTDVVELDSLLEKLDARLLILDPIAAHLRVSIYNDQEVRSVLSPLSKVLTKRNAAAVLIHHTVKNTGSGGHPLRVVGGSGGGLPGAARAVYIFGLSPMDSDQRVLLPIKFNLGTRPTTAYFEMDNEEVVIGKGAKAKLLQTGKLLHLPQMSAHLNPWTVIGSDPTKTVSGTPDRMSEAAEWLTNYLALGERPVKELKEDAVNHAISWSTVRRAAEVIEIVITRTGFGPGGKSLWALPPGHPALEEKKDDDVPM